MMDSLHKRKGISRQRQSRKKPSDKGERLVSARKNPVSGTTRVKQDELMDHHNELVDYRRQFIHLDDVEQHRVERETMVLCVERNIIDKWTSAHITEFQRMRKGMTEKILPACVALEGTEDERSLVASTSYLVIQGVRGQDGAPWAADYVYTAITTPSSPAVGSLVFFVDMANAAEGIEFDLCHPEGRHHLFTGLPFLKANATGETVNNSFREAARGLAPLFSRILFGASGPVG